MFYSVKHKRHIKLNSWKNQVRLVNEDQAYCKTLHYLDYRNHANINLLPSYHPYWSFRVYLSLRRLILSQLRTVRTYSNMIKDSEMDPKLASKIYVAMRAISDGIPKYVSEARELQIKFNETTI